MQKINLDPKRLLIRKPFNEQYTLLVSSETNAVNAIMTSKVRLRWNVDYFNITENSLECRLIKTEHLLVDKNNSIIDEVMGISELFGRIYSELHVRLNHSGQVLEVLNQELIKEKWKQIKKQLSEQLSDSQVKEIFSINDSIINNSKKIKEAAQAQEFFQIYFKHVFNISLPHTDHAVSGYNLLNTANLLWSFKTTSNHPIKSGFNNTKVRFEGRPATLLPAGFYNKAYGQFSDKLNISKLHTTLLQRGEHLIDYDTGCVQKATIEKKEIADPNELFTKLRYELISDKQRDKQEFVSETKQKDPSKSFLAD